MQIFLERFARLSMHRFVCNVRILLVPRAFVIFGAVQFPIAQAHPAEIVFAAEALHVIAAAVLFDAYMAFGAVLCVRTDIVGRFAVVCAFRQPLFDYLAIGGRMIVVAAFEAKRRFACPADCLLRANVLAPNDDLAIWPRAKTQFRMRFHVVLECEMLIPRSQLWSVQQPQHQILGYAQITFRRHAVNRCGNALMDLRFKVHGPAVFAK